MVESLGYRDDLKLLEEFNASFDEYRRLDDEILSLAIENTNLKAQRLSFGAARDAAAAFRTAIDAAIQGRSVEGRNARSTRLRHGHVLQCSRFRSCRRRISPNPRMR